MAVRLRVRSSAGATDIVTVERDATLATLKSLLLERGVARLPFELTLNKSELLCGEKKSLTALGVVAGDLLYVVCPSKESGKAYLPPPDPSGRGCAQTTPPPHKCGRRETSMNGRVTRDGERGERSDVALSHMAEFLSGETAVEASCSPLDLLCFTLHSIMRDTGFSPLGNVLLSSSSSTHTFSYFSPVDPSITVFMACFTMGPQLITKVSAELPGSVVSCQTCLTLRKYIKQGASWTAPSDVLLNTQKLCRQFKDEVTHHLVTDIQRALGLQESGTLTSLSPELKLQVIKCLDVSSLLALSATSKELHTLAQDPLVWKSLLVRDFGRGILRKGGPGGKSDWMKVYRDEYLTRLALKKKMSRRHLVHYPQPFHPPLPLPPPLNPFPGHIPGMIGGEFDRLPPPFSHPQHHPFQPSPSHSHILHPQQRPHPHISWNTSTAQHFF